jgi:hypothetical protein
MYAAGTFDWDLFYWRGRSQDPILMGYSDWAGDVDDRKSTTRLIFFLNDSGVRW